MQYLLSVYHEENRTVDPEAMEAAYKDVDAFNNDLKDDGAFVFAGGLQPTSTATTIRLQDGDVLTTNGPFADTKEQLGGFWIIKAPDLDSALKWAKKGARACKEVVVVRPFQEEPEA